MLIRLIAFFLAVFHTGQAFADCANPDRPAGSIVYNTTYNVPQYCNGSEWIAFGALNPGAGGGGCTSPEAPEGKVVYNSTYHVLQYCDGDDWRSVGSGALGGSCENVCALPWGGNIIHNNYVAAYQTSSVPFGETCIEETRTCYNGTLTGSFSNETCVVGSPSDCALPWGGTIAHDDDATAFQTATVPFGDTCVSENRACTDGALSGSYQYESCTVDGQDNTPDAFSLNDETDVATDSIITSNTVNITGITGSVPVSISGSGNPQFSIAGGGWLTSGSITDGQTLQLRLTSSATTGTERVATVTVGTESVDWSVTTVACAFTFTNWVARNSSRQWTGIASSADGTKLAASVFDGQIYTSTNSGQTWTARESNRNWERITSSDDGTVLVAGRGGSASTGTLHVSTDSGVSWTARESARRWRGLASSSSGAKLVALAEGDKIYTSTNTGTNWTARNSNRQWSFVASSADGTKLAATVEGGQIYTSTDSGVSWTARASSRDWRGIASSADGTKLAAVVNGGQIYTSTDSGVTWTARESSRDWRGIASSSDGTKLAASVIDGKIYTSTDSGVTWTAWGSNRSWRNIASSADGSKLVAVVLNGQIYTSTACE